jgi:hypothetical protein
VVGRVLGHGGVVPPQPRRPVARRTLPSPREPLVLR